MDPPPAHSELHALLRRLHTIYTSEIPKFANINITVPPIIDCFNNGLAQTPSKSSREVDVQDRAIDATPGLRKFEGDVKHEIEIVERFLARSNVATLPQLSTNAPYLLAVWDEIISAPPGSVTAIKKTFLIPAHSKVGSNRKSVAPVQVDVVLDGGRRWIRINTVKNSRFVRELYELDGDGLDNSDEECAADENLSLGNHAVSVPSTENSLMRMARLLLSAAEHNPLPTTNGSKAFIPQVTLRLTRLNPAEDSNEEFIDPRIARTIDSITSIGAVVELGERSVSSSVLDFNVPRRSNGNFYPTSDINLDLSMLIALISDLTHATLPASEEEAYHRFRSVGRWKDTPQGDTLSPTRTNSDEDDIFDSEKDASSKDEKHREDIGQHARALFTQVTHELKTGGLIAEIRARLLESTPPSLSSPALSQFQFWTTPEAKERCLNIVSKIGGEGEKRRARALFEPEGSAQDFWHGSRFPIDYLPGLPVCLLESPSLSSPSSSTSSFSTHLLQTCESILTGADSRDDKEREKITPHTVRSLLEGARHGWTTLTANRGSVRDILRAMHAKQGLLDIEDKNRARASIWLVEPRSLAEGMRVDFQGVPPSVE